MALASKAGQLLLQGRDEFASSPAADRKAAGDKRSHEFLMKALTAERPSDAVLSEDGIDNADRLSANRVWIVDPLDGTREFQSSAAKTGRCTSPSGRPGSWPPEPSPFRHRA